MKYISSIVFFLLITFSLVPFSQATSKEVQIKVNGFNCADQLSTLIPYIGRGTDYPKFLISDIYDEIKRQSNNSTLIQAECNAEPTFDGQTVNKEINGSTATVLVGFTISFPITATIITNGKKQTLQVNQKYKVEKLNAKGAEKVTKTFEVVK